MRLTMPLYEYYETKEYIVITFYLSPNREHDPIVHLIDDNILMYDGWRMELFDTISKGPFIKVDKYKIEIRLYKRVLQRWRCVTLPVKCFCKTKTPGCCESRSECYLTRKEQIAESHLGKREVKEEEKEGGSLFQILQRVYNEGTPDVKRAMNKSFEQSGGTVLTTDWNSIANKDLTNRKGEDAEEGEM